jgi:hypothetical protein
MVDQPQPYPNVPVPTGRPIGRTRSTLAVILLSLITCGIYSLYWFYATSEEMKRHTGEGLGGGLSLIIAFFVQPVSAFITANEVALMYERAGRKAPVSALTGLWYFPGCFILIGPFVWIIKTNGALNAYWRSLGAV